MTQPSDEGRRPPLALQLPDNTFLTVGQPTTGMRITGNVVLSIPHYYFKSPEAHELLLGWIQTCLLTRIAPSDD